MDSEFLEQAFIQPPQADGPQAGLDAMPALVGMRGDRQSNRFCWPAWMPTMSS
jgi:hypothetical protein